MGRVAKILFGVAAVVFLVAPLFAILPLAFTSSVFLTYPVPGWSVRWFEELTTAEVWRRAIVNSLIIGFGTMALATVLGTMAALGLRTRGLFLSGPIRTLFLLPMVVPAVVLGVGMQLFFRPSRYRQFLFRRYRCAYGRVHPLRACQREWCTCRY